MPLLDVILGYDCNLYCDYCTITPQMRKRALSAAAVADALKRGRAGGYDRVSFTGGEPTIRSDLLALIRLARRLGYLDIKVQSNGLLLAHPPNVDRAIEAGVTTFHVSIHTHDREHYERLVQREGTYDAMASAVEALAKRPVAFVADVILKADTYEELPAALRWLLERGVENVDLWFVSLTDQNRENVGSLPAMTDVTPTLREAFAWARRSAVRLRSLHIPRCLLGEDHGHVWNPAAGGVRVVTPDAEFDLATSKITGQVHVPACDGCEFREICPGLREDYLEVYGDGEVAAARSVPPSRAPTRTRGLPVV